MSMESSKAAFQLQSEQLAAKNNELIEVIKSTMSTSPSNTAAAPKQREAFAERVMKNDTESKITNDTKDAFIMITDMRRSVDQNPSVDNINMHQQNFESRFGKYLSDHSAAPLIKTAYQDFSRKMTGLQCADAMRDIEAIMEKKLSQPSYNERDDLANFQKKFASQLSEQGRPIAKILENAKKELSEISGLSNKLGQMKLRSPDIEDKMASRASSEEPGSPYTSPSLGRK